MDTVDYQIDEFLVTVTVTDEAGRKDLNEAKHRGTPLTGPYSYVHNTARHYKAQNHIHIYKRGNEICAINRDGTGHDGSHGFKMPNKVVKALKVEFPNWLIPDNGVIECTDGSEFRMLLLTETMVKHLMP